MKVKLIFSLLALLSTIAFAQAQDRPGWKYPEDPDLRAKTDEKIVLYTDNMKLGNMRVSANHLSWLLQNTPDLNESIYINGAKIYEALVEEASEDEARFVLEDSALSMYDLRIQYFGKEANVLNRKGIVAYKYLKGRKDKYGELYDMLGKTIDVNGNDSYDNNLLAYLDAARRHKLTGGDVSDDTFFEVYSKVTDILDYKRNNGGKPERLDKIAANLDKILSATIEVTCEFVEQNLAPRMVANPEDLKFTKLVFKLLLTAKCSDSEFFLQSAEIIHNNEKTYGLAIVLAKKYSAAKDYDNAEKFYAEALELTEENVKKAEVYMDMAKMAAARGQKSTSRSNALKAVEVDPSVKGSAYSLIGNLYMASYDQCKQGVSRVADRACFLAAYDAYAKAGDSKGMASAKAQFPAIDIIFSENKKEGDSISVGCWIGGTTTIRRRPN